MTFRIVLETFQRRPEGKKFIVPDERTVTLRDHVRVVVVLARRVLLGLVDDLARLLRRPPPPQLHDQQRDQDDEDGARCGDASEHYYRRQFEAEERTALAGWKEKMPPRPAQWLLAGCGTAAAAASLLTCPFLGVLQRQHLQVRDVAGALRIRRVQRYIEPDVRFEAVDVEHGHLRGHVYHEGLRLRIEDFHHELLRQSSVEALRAFHQEYVHGLVRDAAVPQRVRLTCNRVCILATRLARRTIISVLIN